MKTAENFSVFEYNCADRTWVWVWHASQQYRIVSFLDSFTRILKSANSQNRECRLDKSNVFLFTGRNLSWNAVTILDITITCESDPLKKRRFTWSQNWSSIMTSSQKMKLESSKILHLPGWVYFNLNHFNLDTMKLGYNERILGPTWSFNNRN